MKKLLAVSVFGVASVAAFGMEGESIAFRVGFGFPTASATRDQFNQLTAFGFSYDLTAPSYGGKAKPGSALSIDYIGRGDFRNIPILYNLVWRGEGSDLFYSAGLGISFLGSSVNGVSESVARLGYSFGAGFDLSKGQNASFVEVKFNGTGESAFNNVGLYLGVRF